MTLATLSIDIVTAMLYLRGMSDKIALMAFKEWTPDDLRRLLELAESKGISQRQVALEYTGFSPSLLTRLLNGEREIRDMHKAALSWGEYKIKAKKQKKA